MGLKRRLPTPTAVADLPKHEGPIPKDAPVTLLGVIVKTKDSPTAPPQTPQTVVQDKTPVGPPKKPTEAPERPANYGYIGRENCIAWLAVLKDGEPVLDSWNRPLYKLQQVPPQKGQMYCSECHGYAKFKPAADGEKQCPTCGITTNDFNIKTANGLWPTIKK